MKTSKIVCLKPDKDSLKIILIMVFLYISLYVYAIWSFIFIYDIIPSYTGVQPPISDQFYFELFNYILPIASIIVVIDIVLVYINAYIKCRKRLSSSQL